VRAKTFRDFVETLYAAARAAPEAFDLVAGGTTD
jgi:hypothetical protein